jgi:RHS repeat-associated protein
MAVDVSSGAMAPTVRAAAAATAPAPVKDVPLISSPKAVATPAMMPAGVAGGVGRRSAAPKSSDRAAPSDLAQESAGREIVGERTANSRVFRRPDGSRDVMLSTDPLNYESSPGRWKPIDTQVVAAGATGLRSAANAWTARFEGLGEGRGGASITMPNGRAVGMAPRGAGAVAPAATEPEGSGVRYRDAWRSTDLEYTVLSSGVKEDIVLRSADALGRFPFAVAGATAAGDGHGGLKLSGPAGTVHVPRLSVIDATDHDVTAASGAAFRLAAGGTRVDVVVDRAWLKALPRRAFPVRLDPSILPTLSEACCTTSYSSVPSDGAYSGIKLGKDASGHNWRAQIGFDYSAYINSPYQLTGASLELARQGATGGTPNQGRLYVPTAASYAGTKGTPYSDLYQVDSFSGLNWYEFDGPVWGLRQAFQSWFDQDLLGQKIGIVGDEVNANTVRTYTATMTLRLEALPPASDLTTPAQDAVIATRRPTLRASTVTYDVPASFMRYRFDVRIGGSTITSSGWAAATAFDTSEAGFVKWTVPEGVLQDGATYTGTISTATLDMAEFDLPGAFDTGSTRRFKIDMGLGNGGPSPTATAGAVPGVTGSPSQGAPSPGTPGASFTVNMIDGNLAASVPTHSVKATAGAIAPALVYNSRADSQAGLVARYYSDDDSDRAFDATDTLRAQRVDPSVNFRWGSTHLVSGMPANRPALVRWSGVVRVPSNGDWQFGFTLSAGNHVGARLLLGNPSGSGMVTAIDQWNPVDAWMPPQFATARSLTTSQWVPIQLEYWSDSAGSIQLIAKQAGDTTAVVVPQDWLAQNEPVLPQGWQLSAGPAAVGGLVLEDLGDIVLVRSPDGSAEAFTRLVGGWEGFAPPPGGTSHLTVDGNGHFVLSTAAGMEYRFRADGQLEQATTVVDDLHPAALEYTYTGTPLRLREVKDPVSGRKMTLGYGPSECGAPLEGMLCRISWAEFDGAVTSLTYDSSNRLVRVTNPGYQMAGGGNRPTEFDFGYNSASQVTSVRDPLASDLVAYGERTDGPDLRTRLTYDTGASNPTDKLRLKTITPPQVTPTAETSTTTYTYDVANKTTTVQAEGFSPTSGFARRVRWDDSGRIVEDTDAAGLTTAYQWDAQNHVVAQTAPGPLKTAFAFDSAGNKTDTWGPAPADQFGSDNRPIAGASVPHSTTAYDGGLQGLAATYWSNPNLVGHPNAHKSGAGAYDDFAAGPPVTPDAQGDWSMQLTGTIYLVNGFASFQRVAGTGGTKVFVEDQTMIDTDAGQWLGSFHDPQNRTGWYRIRVDFVYRNTGDKFDLQFMPVGSPPAYRRPTLDELRPAYGLPTRQTDADGKVVDTRYDDPTHHIGPELGLPTKTILDPGGLALTTSTTYEDPTVAGNHYLRRLSRTLPAGGTTTTSYWANTEGLPTATCGLPAGSPQGGLPKQVTATDPDGTGSQQPVAQQSAYDPAGRVVGVRSGAANAIDGIAWTCTSFDGRGRTASQVWPARGTQPGRATIYSYAEGNDPLTTKVSEPYNLAAGSVTTTIDIRGRIVGYQAGGTASLFLYDRLSRPTVWGDNGLIRSNDYDPATGRLSRSTVHDGGLLGDPPAVHTVTATPTYDTTTGHITRYDYSNGTGVGLFYDAGGRPAWTIYDKGGTQIGGDLLTRSASGRVVDESTLTTTGWVDANSNGANLSYDAAGRLASYWGPNGQETYSFGTAATGCPVAAIGKDTNLTSVTRGGATETYCYDQADRMTTGTGFPTVTYDDRGNTTTLGNQTYVWDSADRNIGVRAGSTTVDYLRDPLDRILQRQVGSTTLRYLYGGYGDVPTAVTDGSGTVLERSAQLPGGVSVALNPTTTAETWSYPNQHGDVIFTTDRTGTRIGSPRTFGPYGTGSPADTNTDSRDLGYLGSGGNRFTDHATNIEPVIDMGARPYVPRLGRFLATDPEEGGCANAYTYVHGDPVNVTDVDGTRGKGKGTNIGPCPGTFSVQAGSTGFGISFSTPNRYHGMGLYIGIDRTGREAVTGKREKSWLLGETSYSTWFDYSDFGMPDPVYDPSGSPGGLSTTVTVVFAMLDSWNSLRFYRDQDYEYCLAVASDTYNY